MLKHKILHRLKPDNYKIDNSDIELAVFGIFNTEKVEWHYYAVSIYINGANNICLSSDICGYSMLSNIDNICKYGKKFLTKEEGIKYIEDYKIKWETGSNNTIQEQRDEKINNILDNDK